MSTRNEVTIDGDETGTNNKFNAAHVFSVYLDHTAGEYGFVPIQARAIYCSALLAKLIHPIGRLAVLEDHDEAAAVMISA